MPFCCSLLTALCCPLISLLSLLSSLCLSSHFSLLLVGVILRDSPHDCDNHTRLSAAKQSHCSLLPSLFPYSLFSPISSVADAHLLDRTAHQSLRALLQAIDSASTSIHGALCQVTARHRRSHSGTATAGGHRCGAQPRSWSSRAACSLDATTAASSGTCICHLRG